MSERIDKCSRLLAYTRRIGRANDFIQRSIGWAVASKEILSPEIRNEIIDNVKDIQTQVEKIMEEVKEQE